ncbi:hypothetical protein [Nocardia sp. alder85J]|uniref:hypothetical protein n=1 Tax=Nocardia sp. alder85J TaxID=2862949 RepID=UPI001CD4814D|nr:hypothetical protein [Nocardia sp. alder85J]MCX4090929.1 hypothetical protein [Nocardia sp. alder85J]
MSLIRPVPRRWFWSHDIQPNQIDALTMPGMRLHRLSNYRRGTRDARRFAALYHDDGGADAPPRTWLIDADATTASEHAPHAVAVTVDVTPDKTATSFTLVLDDTDTDPARTLHTDLTADDLTALLDEGRAVVDLATYRRDDTRLFAAIVEPRPGHLALFFPALRTAEIRPTLTAHKALPTRARAYHSPAGWQLAVVAEPADRARWWVRLDVDADDVSHEIERHSAYPLDLDATGHGLGVRFAVIAAR